MPNFPEVVKDVIETNRIKKEQEQNPLSAHSLKLDLLKGLLQGSMVGMFVPIWTTALDKLQANIVIKPDIKIKIFATLIDKPFKGYWLNALTNVARYSLVFMLVPEINRMCEALEGQHQKNYKTLAYGIAGMIEGAVMSFRTIFTQQLYTNHNAINFRWLLKKAKTDEMLMRKFFVSAKYAAMRDGIYWPIYMNMVARIEKELRVSQQPTSLTKTFEEFLIGATSGLLSSTISYPVDVLQKCGLSNIENYQEQLKITRNLLQSRALYKPGDEFNEVKKPAVSMVEQYKEKMNRYGLIRTVTNFSYRGFPSGGVRMLFASGATNIALHGSKEAYEWTRNKFSFFRQDAGVEKKTGSEKSYSVVLKK